MPRRRYRARQHRISENDFATLREAIESGCPWVHQVPDPVGRMDLVALVTGAHFGFGHFWTEEDDRETAKILWDKLREEILAQHATRRPGTRPWAWWEWEAPELRRVLGRDVDEDDEQDGNGHDDDGRLPAAQDPDLPTWAKGKSYFGTPRIYDSFRYESQLEFLQRLNLLTPTEKEIFDKYSDIVFTRVSSGIYGKCAGCWSAAREAAKKIDFDLDAAAIPFQTFWLPADLVFNCEHREEWNREGIFTVEYLW